MTNKLPAVLLLGSMALATVACRRKTDPIVTPSPYDFSGIEKTLNDSVPVRYEGKCYAMINLDGNTVYAKGWGGYAGNTRMLIASCSKWLSGAVLMSLVDEGKLKLTDTVGKFLPAFTPRGKGGITIAQLFSHTSGFIANSTQGYESDPTYTLARAVDSIGRNAPLVTAPGAYFNYGGVSMHVAGRICEIASGKSWASLLKEKICDPCNMPDTDFGLTTNPMIAGGARSTPIDYMRFLDMLMRKGLNSSGVRVLSEASVLAMEQSQTSTASIYYTPYPGVYFATKGIYGIGNWRDLTTPADILMENSSPGAFGSHPWINRNKKITGFLFTFLPAGSSQFTLATCLNIRSQVRNLIP